ALRRVARHSLARRGGVRLRPNPCPVSCPPLGESCPMWCPPLGGLPVVSRLGRQTRVLHPRADGEVIQALKRVTREAEHVVDGIVVEAPDAGAARAGGLRFEIQHLADDARFPEEMAIERRAELVEARVEVRDHAEAEISVARDLLVA